MSDNENLYAQITWKRKNQKKWAGAILAFFIVISIAMISVATLYTWTMGMAPAGASAPTWYQQEIPAEPTSMVIHSVLDCKYMQIEGKPVPVYTLDYTAAFTYKNTGNTGKAIAYIPLPKGTVENLVVKLNDNPIDPPNIQYHKIVISLPPNQVNNVIVAYTTRGSYEYSHSVPKDKFMDRFYMKLEIKNIEYLETLPSKCLTPDNEYRRDGSTVFEWDKKDAILRKEIVVKLPEWENPLDTYLILVLAVFFLMIILFLFYYGAFIRIGLPLTPETVGFLIVPFMLLMLSMLGLLTYVGLGYAMVISLIFAIAAMFVVKKRVIRIPRALFEILLLPIFALIFVCASITVAAPYGGTIGIICLGLAICVGVKFFKEHKAPKEKVSIDNMLMKTQALSDEKKQIEAELHKERSEVESLRKRIKEGVFNKYFCTYCGISVSPDFDFCPRCGKSIKRIGKCEVCGSLVDRETSLFCPNCGASILKESK